jgi:hypothetical protein
MMISVIPIAIRLPSGVATIMAANVKAPIAKKKASLEKAEKAAGIFSPPRTTTSKGAAKPTANLCMESNKRIIMNQRKIPRIVCP